MNYVSCSFLKNKSESIKKKNLKTTSNEKLLIVALKKIRGEIK